MSAAPVCYYIYYRVAAAQAAGARRALGSVFAALERSGVAARLLARQDEPLLWMEVYENVGDPARFEATLDALLADHDFTSLLAPGSSRRVERFVAAA